MPAFKLRLERGGMRLDDCLAQADALIARHRSFEFYWFPHTDTVLTKAWDVPTQLLLRAPFDQIMDLICSGVETQELMDVAAEQNAAKK